MKKEFIKRLLESTEIKDEDLFIFIQEYTLKMKNQEVTGQQLLAIAQLIKSGYFNLRFALLEAARLLEMNVITAFDKNGVILKTHVY